MQIAVDQALAALPPRARERDAVRISPDLDPAVAAFDTSALIGPDTADGKKPVARPWPI